VEVEDRPALQRFNDLVLKAKFQEDYPYNMLIDGNDDRGIDIGIMSKFPIQEIRSHIKDLNSENRKIFSRDCPEYDIILPGNKRIILLPNHFKSKRNGVDTESQNRRIAQGKRVHEIAISALSRSAYVLVAGDLNDTPESLTLKELLVDGFTDVQSHTSYPKDRPGTFNTGSKSNKIDYLIMSPELRSKLKTTGIERRGSYHPGTWLPFDTVTSSVEEASDHHMVWAEFDL
jgi:endonuclease/exonuclease/phosphatase family metal-dependent hydrolase